MNTDYNLSSSTSSNLNSILTSTDKEHELLWNNMNTFAIPDDPEESLKQVETPLFPTLQFGLPAELNLEDVSNTTKNVNPDIKEEATAFNISWGGDDKPPSKVHPDLHEQDQPVKLTRPLPKPRGIRKLPEPEPAPDGSIDEDTLKRRKNTDAARRSRLKKFIKVEQLENKVNALQTENAKLTLRNAVLESEKRSLHAKEVEYKKRIKYLEDIIISHDWDFDNNNNI